MPKGKRRWYLVLAAAVVAFAATLLYVCVVAPWLEYRHIESLLGSFKAHPSQETAELLAELLQAGRPTQEQGTRIAQALLEPRVEVRAAHPRTGMMRLCVMYKQRTALPLARDGRRYDVAFTHRLNPRTEDQGAHATGCPWGSRLGVSYEIRLIDRAAPGSPMYPGVVKLDCEVYARGRFALAPHRGWPSRPGWRASPGRWLRWSKRLLARLKDGFFGQQKRPKYYCTFTVPLEPGDKQIITSSPRPMAPRR